MVVAGMFVAADNAVDKNQLFYLSTREDYASRRKTYLRWKMLLRRVRLVVVLTGVMLAIVCLLPWCPGLRSVVIHFVLL